MRWISLISSRRSIKMQNTFSSAHGTFSRIDCILSQIKIKPQLFKKIEIVSNIFSNHSAMKLDVNYKKKAVRNTDTWRLNNTFLNNQQVTEEIKRFLETSDNKIMTTLNIWDAVKAVLRGKFTAIQFYLKKQENDQMDNLTLHLK